MRWTEEDLLNYQQRTAPTLEECGKKHGLTPKPGSLQIILPFKLPTWNQLLAMDHWQRKKVRDWIKERVSECIQSGTGWQTQTGSARKLLLTDSLRLEYSEMIQPNSSKRYRLAKKLARSKKP